MKSDFNERHIFKLKMGETENMLCHRNIILANQLYLKPAAHDA